MTTTRSYIAVVEIDERSAVPTRAAALEMLLDGYAPAITSTPRGRIAVRLRLFADSISQAALRSVTAVTTAAHSDPVALAVMSEDEADELAARERRMTWGIDTTWLDDL